MNLIIIHSEYSEASRAFVLANSTYPVIHWYGQRTEQQELDYQDFCKNGISVGSFPCVVDLDSKKVVNGAISIEDATAVIEAVLLEEKKLAMRQHRNGLISSVDWVFLRHRREIETNSITTLTTEEYSTLCQFVKDLQDVTEQEGFPDTIIWPDMPASLEGKL